MKPIVKITNKRNEIKQYTESGKQTVYLKDGQNFEIMMFNPTQNVILAMIEINGKAISSSGLILKPAQRVFLERYIDTPEKFKFSTYTVEDSKEAKEAIANNGKIEVKFYNELDLSSNYTNLNEITHTPYTPPQQWPPYYVYNSMQNNICNSSTTSANYFLSDIEYNNKPTTPISDKPLRKGLLKKLSGSLETGRVDKGEHSSQKFTFENRSFAYFPFQTDTVYIMPVSQKPVEASEIRTYCTHCGARMKKQTWKFCPNCGTEVQS